MIHSSHRDRKTKAIAEALAMIPDVRRELVPHRPRPVRETDEWLWESVTEFCAAMDRYAERAMEIRGKSTASSCADGRRAALRGNPSAFARDSSALELVDFLNERQAMTRPFSDIDDIGGTPHLVENRFRLNGAAAIFKIIHTQEFPIRQFEGKQKNSVFCIRRHFHSC